MDIDTKLIVDFNVTHVSQVENSDAMEKFGFVKILDRLEEDGITLRSVTTDRHVQIRSFMKQSRPCLMERPSKRRNTPMSQLVC